MFSKFLPSAMALCAVFLLPARAAEVTIQTGHSPGDAGFKLDPVAPPAVDDAASRAAFKIISGVADPNARGGLNVLHDGRVPSTEDAPADNFFFARTPERGRVLVDLGKVIEVREVSTYSWHPGGRAAQQYTLYGADGTEAGFKAEPAETESPPAHGWTLIGRVDTSAKGPGQHAVALSRSGGASLGKFRYLLCETRPNVDPSGFGQTFYSEFDVIDAAAPEVKRVRTEKLTDTFRTDDGKFTFVLDSTLSPDLRPWFIEKVIPEVKTWYPKIVELIGVPGFPSPTTMTLTLKEGTIMPGNRGVPAYAAGTNIVVSSEFLRSQQRGEAVGCVIHEIVHVAQASDWGRGARGRVPSWVTEGVADYIRWFLFEPQSRGAEIRDPDKAKYDASYRITANFFDWVVRHHVRDLPRKLNALYSTGYQPGLWLGWTGKSVEELAAEWKESLPR